MPKLKIPVITGLLVLLATKPSLSEEVSQTFAIHRMDVQTSIGIMSLSGSALDQGEARHLGFSETSTQIVFPVGSRFEAQFDFRLTGTNNRTADDTYNSSLLGAIHLLRPTETGYFGAFIGAVHTNQSTGQMVTSRRLFTGLEAMQNNLSGSAVSAQMGYMFHSGGLDGRGKDSLTDALFTKVSLAIPIDSRTEFNVSLASAIGSMDFDMAPRDAVLINNLSVGITRAFDNQRGHMFARLDYTTYNRRTAGTDLQDLRVSVGLTIPLKRSAKPKRGAFAQRIAPLDRWVAQTGGPLE